MPLVDHEIIELCRDRQMLTPFTPELVNPASVDVCIGHNIRVETEDGWVSWSLEGSTKDKPYFVQPKEFLLAETLEVFNMPDNVAGEFRIKSSRAREGWNNALAVWLDPGWHGSVLTLELINECRFTPLPIYPGLRIGQIIFHRCNVPAASYRITGRYNGDRTVQGSRG